MYYGRWRHPLRCAYDITLRISLGIWAMTFFSGISTSTQLKILKDILTTVEKLSFIQDKSNLHCHIFMSLMHGTSILQSDKSLVVDIKNLLSVHSSGWQHIRNRTNKSNCKKLYLYEAHAIKIPITIVIYWYDPNESESQYFFYHLSLIYEEQRRRWTQHKAKITELQNFHSHT